MLDVACGAGRCADIAIDFGTASVRVAAGAQLVRERRSVIGQRRALAGGVIIDLEAAIEVLRPLLYQARRWMGFPHIRALACAPTDATLEEKSALADCIRKAGAAAVHIVPEPLAAAIGGDIDVASPYAKLIIDIGEGVTDCAIIQSARVVTSMALRVGCWNLREAIRKHVLERHQIILSDDELESLLWACGVAGGPEETLTAKGCRNGETIHLAISSRELRAAMASDLGVILAALETLVHDLPPSSSVELIEEGLYLSGGGSLLKGMAAEIVRSAQVDAHILARPCDAVLRGARMMLSTVSALHLWKE